MSSPDPAISDAYAALGANDAPPQMSTPAKLPPTVSAPLGRFRAHLPASQARCLVWGYLSVIIGFAASLLIPLIPSVFWGLVAVGLVMALMVVGMGLVVFAMLRNAIRSL